jgi:aspartate racemase
MLKNKSDPIIGIVGGMGPQAGAALFNSILRNTSAAKDQQHLSTILMSFPSDIVDRTAFLQGQVDINPGYAVAHIILQLEKAGASIVGISCNTCHSPKIFDLIVRQLQTQGSRVILLNMPLETCKGIAETYPHARKIGLMATTGTLLSGTYHRLLTRMGYEPIIPDAGFQQEVIHRMIYDPKSGLKATAGAITGNVNLLAKKAMGYFRSRNADAVILGCTDLSVLLEEPRAKELPLIDSTESLGKALIKAAKRPVLA